MHVTWNHFSWLFTSGCRANSLSQSQSAILASTGLAVVTTETQHLRRLHLIPCTHSAFISCFILIGVIIFKCIWHAQSSSKYKSYNSESLFKRTRMLASLYVSPVNRWRWWKTKRFPSGSCLGLCLSCFRSTWQSSSALGQMLAFLERRFGSSRPSWRSERRTWPS